MKWMIFRRSISGYRQVIGGLAAAAAVALTAAAGAAATATPAVYSADESPSEVALAAYRALSASQSRNYDRAQDISPRQLVVLLEVTERTEASLGQALATGEMESAHTWNDHVRPTLKNGSLGSATGVWQFLPATFHGIIKKYGIQLLSASDADAAGGRDAMDLGEGPFTDAQVRSLIAETVAGKRGADDEELQLLRHNFAVLAFAKHYLSVESGATTPEEDYLYHFLGAGQGRRVLALARGEARDTLCVKPVEVPVSPLEAQPELAAGDGIGTPMTLAPPPQGAPTVAPVAPPRATSTLVVVPARSRPARAPRGLAGTRITIDPLAWSQATAERPAGDGIAAMLRAEAALRAMGSGVADPIVVFPVAPALPPPVSSQWGLPANSPTVTGNLGMFYRDGKGQSQPYTWAGFMEHLAKRVRAKDQPALVRAKYGVGFGLTGGDMPQWAFNPEKPTEPAAFRHENGQTLLVPEPLITGPLDRGETRQYKERLAALVSQGEAQPLDTLPPEAWAALQHLRLLPPKVQERSTTHPDVQKALHGFRKQVGKDKPDDPALAARLLPAERIALEIYDRRLTRYAQLQAGQQASLGDALDLNRVRKMPAGLQRAAAPHIAAVQSALAAQGLLTPPTQKFVWRDKKRKKHVEYKTAPFPGKPDKATVTALNSFQWRNGLRRTEGILDGLTLSLLGLPPLGPEVFLPLKGPQCPFDGWGEDAPLCATLAAKPISYDITQVTRRGSCEAPLPE